MTIRVDSITIPPDCLDHIVDYLPARIVTENHGIEALSTDAYQLRLAQFRAAQAEASLLELRDHIRKLAGQVFLTLQSHEHDTNDQQEPETSQPPQSNLPEHMLLKRSDSETDTLLTQSGHSTDESSSCYSRARLSSSSSFDLTDTKATITTQHSTLSPTSFRTYASPVDYYWDEPEPKPCDATSDFLRLENAVNMLQEHFRLLSTEASVSQTAQVRAQEWQDRAAELAAQNQTLYHGHVATQKKMERWTAERRVLVKEVKLLRKQLAQTQSSSLLHDQHVTSALAVHETQLKKAMLLNKSKQNEKSVSLSCGETDSNDKEDCVVIRSCQESRTDTTEDAVPPLTQASDSSAPNQPFNYGLVGSYMGLSLLPHKSLMRPVSTTRTTKTEPATTAAAPESLPAKSTTTVDSKAAKPADPEMVQPGTSNYVTNILPDALYKPVRINLYSKSTSVAGATPSGDTSSPREVPFGSRMKKFLSNN